MKDIDQLLTQHMPKPKRELNSTFSNTVIMEIRTTKHTSKLQRLLHAARGKVGLAVATGFILVGGTAAALTLWPTPNVETALNKELPSGNHIVGYNTTNCQYYGTTEGSVPKTNEALYYEVRAGSTLTDEQLRNSLQAVCAENISNEAISKIAQTVAKNSPNTSSTLAYRVEAVGANGITVSPDLQYDASQYTVKPHQTFAHFADNLVVQNQAASAQFSDIQVGDTVKMLLQAMPSNTDELRQLANDPETVTVLAILKVPPLTADPTTFYTATGEDLVRLEPCTSSPTGYCRAYEFIEKH